MKSKIINIAIYIFFLPLVAHASSISDDLAKLGEQYLEKSDYEKAKFYLEQSMVSDPLNVRAYTTLALVYKADTDYEKAKKYYEISLTIEPTNVQNLLAVGELEMILENVESAEDYLRKIEELCTNDCEEYKKLKYFIDNPSEKVSWQINQEP